MRSWNTAKRAGIFDAAASASALDVVQCAPTLTQADKWVSGATAAIVGVVRRNGALPAYLLYAPGRSELPVSASDYMMLPDSLRRCSDTPAGKLANRLHYHASSSETRSYYVLREGAPGVLPSLSLEVLASGGRANVVLAAELLPSSGGRLTDDAIYREWARLMGLPMPARDATLGDWAAGAASELLKQRRKSDAIAITLDGARLLKDGVPHDSVPLARPPTAPHSRDGLISAPQPVLDEQRAAGAKQAGAGAGAVLEDGDAEAGSASAGSAAATAATSSGAAVVATDSAGSAALTAEPPGGPRDLAEQRRASKTLRSLLCRHFRADINMSAFLELCEAADLDVAALDASSAGDSTTAHQVLNAALLSTSTQFSVLADEGLPRESLSITAEGDLDSCIFHLW